MDSRVGERIVRDKKGHTTGRTLMGIQDRDYMRPDRRRSRGRGVSIKNRIIFLLWRMMRRFRGRS